MLGKRLPRALVLSLTLALLGATACAPAPAASPTAAPAKPAATAAPAKPTEAPAAKPAEAKPAASPAAKAEAKPTEAAKPAEKPATAASPAAKPTAAAKPAEKPAFDEKAIADFYRGKTVRIIVGFAPGGTYDTSARLSARYLPKYLPGNPTVVVENRAGAGSAVAANAVYAAEAKDGTFILAPHENIVLQQALGAEGIQFDAARFNWLGNAMLTTSVCGVRSDTGVKGIQDLVDGKQVAIGTIAPGTTSHDTPALINALLGTKMKLVPGYPGFAQVKVAVESKEVDGACGGFDGFTLVMGDLITGNPPTIKMLVRMAGSKPINHPALKDVPLADSLAKTEEARQIIRIADAPAEMSKPLAVAPEVPRDRVEALRAALVKVYADPEFVAEAKKANLDVIANTGPEVQQIVQRILSAPAEIRTKLKDMLK